MKAYFEDENTLVVFAETTEEWVALNNFLTLRTVNLVNVPHKIVKVAREVPTEEEK